LKEETPCRKTREEVSVSVALYINVDVVKLEVYLNTLKVALSPVVSAGDAEKHAEWTNTGRSNGMYVGTVGILLGTMEPGMR
jgi:hypothetical protein